MKKTLIVLGVIALTLTLGLTLAGFAYAGPIKDAEQEWPVGMVSADNNLGILLYNDIHAPATALGKCEIRNFGSGEISMIKDAEEVWPAGVSSADNNLGILLFAETSVPEAMGSGAGGVTDKCVTEMGTGKSFDEIYVHSVTVRPF